VTVLDFVTPDLIIWGVGDGSQMRWRWRDRRRLECFCCVWWRRRWECGDCSHRGGSSGRDEMSWIPGEVSIRCVTWKMQTVGIESGTKLVPLPFQDTENPLWAHTQLLSQTNPGKLTLHAGSRGWYVLRVSCHIAESYSPSPTLPHTPIVV
jgi:hypothetical protein